MNRIPEPSSKKGTKIYLDRAFRDYGRGNVGVYIPQAYHLCGPNSRILDAGCGIGTHMIGMARANPLMEFVGVDRNRDAIKYANLIKKKEGVSNVRFIRSGIYNLLKDPSVLRKFDVVYSTETLHEMPLKKTILAAYLLLKEGGIFMFRDFDRNQTQKRSNVIQWDKLRRKWGHRYSSRLDKGNVIVKGFKEDPIGPISLDSQLAAWNRDEVVDVFHSVGFAQSEVWEDSEPRRMKGYALKGNATEFLESIDRIMRLSIPLFHLLGRRK